MQWRPPLKCRAMRCPLADLKQATAGSSARQPECPVREAPLEWSVRVARASSNHQQAQAKMLLARRSSGTGQIMTAMIQMIQPMIKRRDPQWSSTDATGVRSVLLSVLLSVWHSVLHSVLRSHHRVPTSHQAPVRETRLKVPG